MSRQIRDREEYEIGSKWFSHLHRTWDDDMTAIDVDLLGYCRRCFKVLYVVEATREKRKKKTAIVCEKLAAKIGVPLFVVYQDDDRPGEMLMDDRLSETKAIWWISNDQARVVFRRLHDTHTREEHP